MAHSSGKDSREWPGMNQVVVMECLAKSLRRRRTPMVPLGGVRDGERQRARGKDKGEREERDIREDTSTDVRGAVLTAIGA